MYTTDKGFNNLINQITPIQIQETAEAADGAAFLTGIPGNDELEESDEKIEIRKEEPQKIEKVPEQKEKEPVIADEHDGWGAWKDPPKEEIKMQEEEFEIKTEQEYYQTTSSNELNIQDTSHQ